MTTSELIPTALSWLGTYGLHSSLFLGAAWGLSRWQLPRRPRNRERLWRLALVGGLLSATLQLTTGARPLLGHIAWVPLETLASADAAPTDVPAGDREAAALAPASATAPGSSGLSEPVEPLASLLVPARRDAAQAPARGSGGERARGPLPRREPRPRDPAPNVPDSTTPSRIEAPDLARESGRTAAVPVAPAPEPRGLEPREAGPESSPSSPGAAPVPLGVTPLAGEATALAPHALLDPDPLDGGPARETVRETVETAGAPIPAATRLAAWRGRALPGLVLLLWTAASLLGLLALAGSWTSVRRLLLGRRVVCDGPLFEILERLQRRLQRGRAGWRSRRRVRLSVSERVRSPLSTGILRPEICLPAAVLTELTPAQQEAMLAHELAHAMRRDPAWFGLYFLLERLFFFQPLNRLARRELSELAELACDDWAVRWTGQRLALASCLAEVAGWVLDARPRRALLPGLAGTRSRLSRRVERLLDDRRSPAGDPPARWWPPLALTAVAAATLAVPGVSSVRPATLPGHGLEGALGIEPLPPATSAGSESTSGALAPEEPAPEPEPWSFAAERAALEEELELLQGELAQLRAELAGRELSARLAQALEEIELRMTLLRTQHERLQPLLDRIGAPQAAATRPTPNTPSR